jgi:hypothetical protein
MEPRIYCQEAIDRLRVRGAESFSGAEDKQVVVVLAYFAQQKPSERDFTSGLKLLAESATRSGRSSLAAAANAVLSDWQATAASHKTSPEPET